MRYEELYLRMHNGTAAPSIPAWAGQVLREIAAGVTPISAVRHPLGFLCLPIERTGRLGVCLHLWSPDVAPLATTSQIHCHSWDLVSHVLYGRLRNITTRTGEGRDLRVFEVLSRGDTDELRATPRTVKAVRGETATHGPGDVYALPAGVFHSTLLDAGPDAATVALGVESPIGRDLSLGALDLRSHQVRRTRCEPTVTTRAARRAADLLAAQVAS
jgi:hypothetical protein